MKTPVCWFLVALLASAPAIAQPSPDPIGHIQKIDGTVSILRDGATLPGTVGAPLVRGDRVRTGKPGAAGIVLTDDTSIALGPDSEFSLLDYAFEPKENRFGLVLRMIRGTFAYVSGQVSKLAPDKAQVQTPDATIAVRGTKLLVEIKE